ncbi:MAG: tRNA lysidine(34) synthetase TilS, partial [Lachnospiraceae bacterium]|nr:tRNA lysidine(34) synthetase TilS [Lachnospiraceae bacterium]
MIKGFDKKLIKDNGIYVVALSGGSDSMCLLHSVIALKKEKHIDIKAIHINHGIRGTGAERDEDFVRKYCKDNDIDIYVFCVDCIKYAKDNHKTLEEAARILRYIEFDDYIDKLKKKEKKDVYLLVAHHKKDKIETIIHNIA